VHPRARVRYGHGSDTDVWRYAAEHGYTIISKDADFHQRSLLFGGPPQVVWLRVGNCTVSETAAIVRERYVVIRRFIEESDPDFLVLSKLSTPDKPFQWTNPRRCFRAAAEFPRRGSATERLPGS